MNLLGIEFGRVLNASGARNFFGERHPYWFHRLGPLAPDFRGSTFVAKTTTVGARAGNMPLAGTRPREWKPRCIKVNFRKGAVLNAVGLSGPGLGALLADGRWQARTDPFFLSFMSVEDDPAERLREARTFANRVAMHWGRFRAPFGIECNFSCPNVGLDPTGLVAEGRRVLSEMSWLLPGVPLVPKLNALVPVEAARELAASPHCAALVVSNTIPWGALPDLIDWKGLFGEVSPLAEFGGGGLSGAPLLPLVAEWINDAVTMPGGFPVPIVGGGGVLSVADARFLRSVGAAAVELGSVAILRPWRVRGIVQGCQ